MHTAFLVLVRLVGYAIGAFVIVGVCTQVEYKFCMGAAWAVYILLSMSYLVLLRYTLRRFNLE